jgi:HAD superfamily hydrolase (TIGR01509 family)
MTNRAGKIKCVIFDCDGVLVDSEPLCCQALVDVFAQFDVSLQIDECMAHFQGGKTSDILSHTLGRHGLDIPLDDVEPLYRSRVKTLFESALQPVNGAEELLTGLNERGIQYCAISNSPASKIALSLQLTHLSSYFEGRIFSAFDANSWKPDPDLLLYAAMNMGVSPDNCLYVDDSRKGVEAGISAGIQTIHLRTSQYTVGDQQGHVLEMSHLNQILSYVEQAESN